MRAFFFFWGCTFFFWWLWGCFFDFLWRWFNIRKALSLSWGAWFNLSWSAGSWSRNCYITWRLIGNNWRISMSFFLNWLFGWTFTCFGRNWHLICWWRWTFLASSRESRFFFFRIRFFLLMLIARVLTFNVSRSTFMGPSISSINNVWLVDPFGLSLDMCSRHNFLNFFLCLGIWITVLHLLHGKVLQILIKLEVKL